MIKIHDDAHLLTSADRATIESAAGAWPFEAHVLIRNAGSSDALGDAAHAAVTGPGVVVIAVDPAAHHTAVRFGTASHVKTADYDSIAKAGNEHFRAGEWGAGIAAIGTRAEASAASRVAMAVANEPVVVEHGLSTGAWVGIALLFAAVVTAIVVVVRRMRRNEERFASAASDLLTETNTYYGRNTERADARAFDTRLRAVAGPTTVVVDRGGSNDLLTGVLLGEALSDRGATREVIYEDRSSRDSGGGSSSWDSGGGSDWSSSSSSSDDSGGSSSSWDSGGSDFGGGGDSGGGGSDAGW